LPHADQQNEELKLVTARRLGDVFGQMNELVFEVIQEEDGGYCAECLSENIFTQGDDWDALRRNVQEAVRAYHFDQPRTCLDEFFVIFVSFC
jgi:hypothetical protein